MNKDLLELIKDISNQYEFTKWSKAHRLGCECGGIKNYDKYGEPQKPYYTCREFEEKMNKLRSYINGNG